MGILQCFQESSGLKVNLAKSRLYGVGVESSVVENVAINFHCSHDSLPFFYLGLPVGRHMRKEASWNGVIDSFVKRLTSWKSRLLSIGGRLTLVKAVLWSLPVFYLFLL